MFLTIHHTFSPISLSVTRLLGDWQERLQYMDADFQHKEPVLALRSSSLHAILKQAAQQLSRSPSPSLPSHTQMTKSNALFSGLNQALLTQAELAREAGMYQVESVVHCSCGNIGPLVEW